MSASAQWKDQTHLDSLLRKESRFKSFQLVIDCSKLKQNLSDFLKLLGIGRALPPMLSMLLLMLVLVVVLMVPLGFALLVVALGMR